MSPAPHKIPCTNCGAALNYKANTTSLVCPYCSTTVEIELENEVIKENDLREFLRTAEIENSTREVRSINCTNCGAHTEFNDAEKAKDCVFCGEHLLLDNAQTRRTLVPDALLPFAFEKDKAFVQYFKWINSRWLAPNKLKKKENGPAQFQTMYIPFWTFDAKTFSKYKGQRGDTERYRDGDEWKTRTNWSRVRGSVQVDFDDVLVLASKNMPKKFADELDPWDLQNLVKFNADFLRGYNVETYSVGIEAGFDEGQDRMNSMIRRSVRRDIGGDQQRIQSLDTTWNDLKYKLILLPMWMSTFQYEGKSYQFLINGRTGEVQGERPYSKTKIALLVILGIIIIVAIAYFNGAFK